MGTKAKYETAIFDCDGVILDSNDMKRRAFIDVISNYSEHQKSSFETYLRKNGGVARGEKFKYFLEEICGFTPSEHAIENLVRSFASVAAKNLNDCETVPGIERFLHELDVSRKVVVSGGAQDEVTSALKSHGLIGHFSSVHGSPRNKYEIVNSLLSVNKIARPTIYFGDSTYDAKVCEHFGFDLFFIYGCSEFDEFRNIPALEKKEAAVALGVAPDGIVACAPSFSGLLLK